MNIFDHLFYRWHPEVALRYLPLVDAINIVGKDATVLDVGSGGLGIAPYLKRPITGLDIRFDHPFHPLLKQVKGSALNMPFKDSAFDIVVSADTLEHMSKEDRKKAISEMVRVARRSVMIAVPSGHAALEQDKTLDDEYAQLHGKRFHFLEEQVGYGLPEEEDIMEAIKQSGEKAKKRVTIKIIGNENLTLRKFLMRGWMSRNFLINIIHRKLFLFLIPVFRLWNTEPTYRKIFLVTMNHSTAI